MGKKSKKPAGSCAKAKGADSAASRGEVGAGDACGGILTSGSKKLKLKCVHCFANVREGKGTSCPGCSMIFCWRCEKKYFEECPGGSDCINPIRRCIYCSGGETMQNAITKVGVPRDDGTGKVLLTHDDFEIFQDRILEDDRLSMMAMPFAFCNSDGCKIGVCSDCFMDPKVDRVLRCVSCEKCQCRFCQRKTLLNPNSVSQVIFSDACSDAILAGKSFLDDDDIKRVCARLQEVSKEEEANLLFRCRDCKDYYCYACLDDRCIESCARVMLGAMMQIQGVREETRFQCNACYWSSKPCTNPTCPNEAGVPTKRCGGCHLDRYCSVECQTAAYPEHIARCQTIQAKRTAAEKREGE